MFWIKKKSKVSPAIADVARAFANGDKEFRSRPARSFQYEREDGTMVHFKPVEHDRDNDGKPEIQIRFVVPVPDTSYTKTVLFGDYGEYPLTDEERLAIEKAFTARTEIIDRRREEDRERVLQRFTHKY